MITLTEWQLNRTFSGDILAHGYVTGHHRLKDGDLYRRRTDVAGCGEW